MILVEDCASNESYGVVQDETNTKWLVIRKRVNDQTGLSPLVCVGETLPDALARLGNLIEGTAQ